MKVVLNDWQLEVARDQHRFKVICAGRRSGKSVLARLSLLKWALTNIGTYYLVSPTYKQAKSIHWVELRKEVPRSWIAKSNETELSIQLKNGSVIELKGAENPDALRGIKLRGLVIDEIASIRNWDWLWSEVLRPTLTDYEAPAIFISTPKGYNHFFELYQAGQEEGDYKSWRFTSYDNPYIPKQEIDAQQKELTEDQFAQEFLADFRKYTGLVFKEFQRVVHVIDPIDIPNTWTWYRGFDFGTSNPFVCLWIAVDNDDNWYIADEIYDTSSTTDVRAGMVNTKTSGKTIYSSYGDPAGTQEMLDLNSKGVHIDKANKEIGQAAQGWVRFGIEKIQERLKVYPGLQPKLKVFTTCVNTIREFETYRWKEKSVAQAQDLNEPDVPEKANDHAMDALRYFAVSYRKHTEVNMPPPYEPMDKIIGI